MSEYIVEMPKEPAKVVRDGWNVRIEWQYKQREEIVRCEDCKYWRRFYPESEQRFGTCRAWRYTTRFDGYCHNASKSDGERQGE